MMNLLNTSDYANHCAYVLYKAIPHTNEWWFECAADDREWINQRAMCLQDEGMWVYIKKIKKVKNRA